MLLVPCLCVSIPSLGSLQNLPWDLEVKQDLLWIDLHLWPVCANTTWANVVKPCFTGQSPAWGAVTSRDCGTEHRRKAGLCV